MKHLLLDMILDDDYASIDQRLPTCIDFLRKKGAGRIWHKNGSFLEHLIGVWRILKFWGVDSYIARAGLMHSIYGSSFGTPCFFHDRFTIKKLVGEKCEEIIFKFCQIDRQTFERKLIDHHPLVPQFSFPLAHDSKKLIILTPKELAIFILLSLADFLEQHSSWQESMWIKELENKSENLSDKEKSFLPLVASKYSNGLWPGNRTPFATRFNYLFSLSRPLHTLKNYIKIPAIFCLDYFEQRGESKKSYGISIDNEILARNLYRQILRDEEEYSNNQEFLSDLTIHQISKVISLNPYIGEPYFLKAQLYLQDRDNHNRFNEAQKLSSIGLQRFCDWGCAWDKRVSFSGWITWGKRLLAEAESYK